MTITQIRADLDEMLGMGIDHYICSDCWPDYVPGRIVVAFCGTRVPDTDLYYEGFEHTNPCIMCTTIIERQGACYRCGR